MYWLKILAAHGVFVHAFCHSDLREHSKQWRKAGKVVLERFRKFVMTCTKNHWESPKKMGWLGVYHTCLCRSGQLFLRQRNSLRKWLGSYQGGPANGPSSVAAVEAADSASKWIRSARKPMLLWNRKLPNLQSYHQNPNLWWLGRSFSIPNHIFFFQKMMRIKNWLNVETSEKSQEQTNQPFNLSTVQPANPPTFQPSN